MSAGSLCDPTGVAVDASGNLYVADTENNRVLEYDTPLVTGTTADRELGQVDFLHNLPNFPDQRSLYKPTVVAIDKSTTPNRLYVADWENSRVLGWKDVTAFSNGSPPTWSWVSRIFTRLPAKAVARTQARATCANRQGLRWTPAATSTSPTRTTAACSNTMTRSLDAVPSRASEGPPIWCSGSRGASLPAAATTTA